MTDFIARKRADGDFDLIDEATGAVVFPLSAEMAYIIMLEHMDIIERQALLGGCESDEERDAVLSGIAYADKHKPSRSIADIGISFTIKFDTSGCAGDTD